MDSRRGEDMISQDLGMICYRIYKSTQTQTEIKQGQDFKDKLSSTCFSYIYHNFVNSKIKLPHCLSA